ncbi:TMEM161A [Cordylochernes scorpioides]|uniref:TMEM161A n=1 Tax=Cordylochernes scorpioides TaxID=51811 RepID=A0ABY6KNR6_9ARAC|nr:TMEM161A [Cordylochernes scorpioides]
MCGGGSSLRQLQLQCQAIPPDPGHQQHPGSLPYHQGYLNVVLGVFQCVGAVQWAGLPADVQALPGPVERSHGIPAHLPRPEVCPHAHRSSQVLPGEPPAGLGWQPATNVSVQHCPQHQLCGPAAGVHAVVQACGPGLLLCAGVAWHVPPPVSACCCTVVVTDQPYCSLTEAGFDSLRLWLLVAVALLRLALLRPYLQAHLNLAPEKVGRLQKEAGRISNIDLQRTVSTPPRGLIHFVLHFSRVNVPFFKDKCFNFIKHLYKRFDPNEPQWLNLCHH